MPHSFEDRGIPQTQKSRLAAGNLLNVLEDRLVNGQLGN